MVTESWKRVTIEGLQEYEVSDYGRVRHKSKIIKPSVTRGYYSVGLYTAEHKKTTIHVHKLVAADWVIRRIEKMALGVGK